MVKRKRSEPVYDGQEGSPVQPQSAGSGSSGGTERMGFLERLRSMDLSGESQVSGLATFSAQPATVQPRAAAGGTAQGEKGRNFVERAHSMELSGEDEVSRLATFTAQPATVQPRPAARGSAERGGRPGFLERLRSMDLSGEGQVSELARFSAQPLVGDQPEPASPYAEATEAAIAELNAGREPDTPEG